MKFRDLATVSYQGTVVALARGSDDQSRARLLGVADDELKTDIYYDVLALQVGAENDDALDWSGFARLDLPNAARPVGMNIVNVPVDLDASHRIDGLDDAGAPFRVATNQDYLFLFRQTKRGTLLVNRLRLVRVQSAADAQGVHYRLDPAWEVRYQRSGKPDTPADDRDIASYRSPDNTPFVEPGLELFMVRGVVDGNFDVAFLPNGDTGLLTCAVFVSDRATNTIRVWQLPLDAAGEFDLASKSLVDGVVAPDLTFELIDEKGATLALGGRPSAAVYLKQERVSAADDSFLVKRAGRLLLGVQAGAPVTLATVDFAIAADGTLATPAAELAASPVGVANYAVELTETAHIELPAWTLGAAFSLDVWLYPEAFDVARQIVLGNRTDPSGPYVALVSGTAIEVGFAGANGKRLTARTADAAVSQRAWSRVQVSFDADATPRFSIKINNFVVPVAITGDGDTPDIVPIDVLGAAAGGFEGVVDELAIYGAAGWPDDALVGRWHLDTIEYSREQAGRRIPIDPPETPNERDPKSPGRVFGGRLIPSTSPIGNTTGALSWDARGLSIYAAYFADLGRYGEVRSSPCLLAGSDGIVHCYFRGRDDVFSVMQLDTEIARATFESGWSAAAGAETGRVQFAAAQAGSLMNTASIVVASSPAPIPRLYCDVTLMSPSGRVETWSGVPRSLSAFTAVLGGASLADPDDARVAAGSRVYYDATGSHSAAYVPIASNAQAAALALVSRQDERLPLASVEVAAGPSTATVTTACSARRWPGVTRTDTWPGVPIGVAAMMSTLGGTSTTYNYRSGSTNVPSYSVAAYTELAPPNRVVLFTRPSVTSVRRILITNGSDPSSCDVELSIIDGGTQNTAHWADVPRLQGELARVLEGDSPSYAYSTLATGDWRAIGAALIVTTDGAAALVDNADCGGADDVPADDDLRVSASLFATFATAAVGAGEVVPSTGGAVAASTFQRAVATDGGTASPIEGPSTLFSAVPAALPAQGAAGLVDDTSALDGGKASLALQGFDGGWLNQAADRTLAFDWTNWVEFPIVEAEAPEISAITIHGDLSLELWCHPTASRGDAMQPYQRLLTFSRTPAPDEGGGDPVQLMAGLLDRPSLVCAADTVVRQGFASTDVTFLTWFAPRDAGGKPATGVIGSISTLGVTNPVIAIRLTDAQIRAEWVLDPRQPPLVASPAIAADTWHQVAVTCAVSAKAHGGQLQYAFGVVLYVDGSLQGTATYTATRPANQPIELAEMVLGDIQGPATLPMRVNEAALFQRVLDANDVEHYFGTRIPDNADGLMFKWRLDEGTSATAGNSAPTGTAFDAVIRPEPKWQPSGLYMTPVLGHGANIGVLGDAPILRGWSHLALVHQAGYAVALTGVDYGNCGRDRSLDLGDSFSLEAWVQPDGQERLAPQTAIGKGDDYELGLDPAGKPRFRVAVTTDADHTFEIVGPSALEANEPAYLAATYEIVSVNVSDGDKGKLPRYECHMSLYVNGARVAWGIQGSGGYQRYERSPRRVTTTADVELGRSSLRNGSSYLRGPLADVRVWNRVLEPGEIAAVQREHRPPTRRDGLVSYWRFAEVDGKVAFDSVGQNNARLNRGDLRTLYLPTASNWFYVDGAAATPTTWIESGLSVGGYGNQEAFQFGRVAGDVATGFCGQLDDVRLWAVQRTEQQISDCMNQALTGAEPGLRGYWSFDAGSGTVVADATGRGNNGRLAGAPPPVWDTSGAPLANEAPAVFNILGGISTASQIEIDEMPAVIDYAAVERDAYGAIFSVMKRAYASVFEDALTLVTGFKVGDLDTVYIGQAQSQPSLIGFIEGAPPIPAENQTMPYWLGGYSSLNQYAGASQVAFTEADNVQYTYNTDRDTSTGSEWHVKAGGYADGKVSESFGIGAEVQTQIAAFEGHVGYQTSGEDSTRTTANVNVQASTNRVAATALKPGGAWEDGLDPRAWVNPTVGRRYIPNNNGLALVKSLTVDVYASVLRTTGAMVKLTMVPNPDIPADVNLIDFPIDPLYVKNGTLDGKVGLQNDPSYPHADQQRGSYFKPIEAYSIKRQIERDEAALEAYYQQWDGGGNAGDLLVGSSPLAAVLGAGTSWPEYLAASRDSPAYDWAKHLAKRSIVNTYVWTAGGGSYAEEEQASNVYTESYGGVAANQGGDGAVGDFKIAFSVAGPYTEFDYMSKWEAQVNAVKTKQEGAAFSLSALASPEPYLYAPHIAAGDVVTFGDSPTEGKVDEYRYMAFFLAPSQDNADTFFETVVDRNWLKNSRSAAAAALRETAAATNGAWRVLYRVTFVSRVPPQFQPVPATSPTPAVRAPVNLEYNALMVALVEQLVATTDPTPVEIGDAIAKVIGTAAAPGLLRASLPWWDEFLADTTDYTLPAAQIVRALREDLLHYMTARYAALADGGRAELPRAARRVRLGAPRPLRAVRGATAFRRR